MKRFRFERDAEQDRELDGAGEGERHDKVRRVSPGKLSRSAQLGQDVHRNPAAAPVSPGKRAPTSRLAASALEQVSVQHRRTRPADLDEREELEIAARGLTGSGGPLPYLEELQRAFGRHQLTGIRVATGGEAGRANQRMGSVAYAMGDAVVFRDSSPDLFTVAHEAAHVIQQRAGAVATGTVGQSGDRHEAHADAVAERVVRGQSAEDLLDQVAPDGASPGAAPSGPASVQRLDDDDYEGLTTVQAIHQALDDDEADDALTLMRRLDGADQVNVVLNSYQSLATSCFGNSEIAEAAGILVGRGGSLSRALDWMYDEGTDWHLVAGVIASATSGQKAALKTDAWRSHFVDTLGEDEMSELVDLLGLGLYDQLDWMSQVGTDWRAVRSKIVRAPAAERAELVTNGWRDWFVEDVVDNEEMSELVDLLGMDLVSKLDWMYEEGTDWSAVKSKIIAAPAEERAALVSDGWRAWFVELADDIEEMSELVDLLGLGLYDQLDWMSEVGADWDAVRSKIVAATPEERTVLVTDGWRDWFVDDVVGNEEMSELVDLLGLGLSDKLDWMDREGTDWAAVKSKIVAAPAEERAALVSDGWRDWFVDDVVGNEEMSELVDLLDLRLSGKLDWMWRAGTSWGAVRSKIEAAPADQRLALVTDAWRDWFADDVVDNEEMSELVDLIGMPLASKLDWMRTEGADYEAIIGKVVTAPVDERPAVYDSDLREFFVKHCNDEEMAVVVILLGGTLVQQLSWMAAEGSRADLVLDRVNAAPADQRLAIHDDSAVREMIREFIPRDRVPIIEAAGGTPAQQMDLFGADTAMRLLTWATPSADWVDAIVAVRESPLDLFELAKDDPSGWAPFIQPNLWDILAGHEDTLYPEDRVAVFWAAYGSGATFTADQILHFFKLVFGREIQPASEDVTRWTGGLTRTRYSVVAPTTATAQALMDCVKPGGGSGGIGRAEVATGTIAFCTHEHKEELGISGWATLESKVLETSYFADPYVIIRAVGPDPRRLGVQPGELDSNPMGVAADGTPNAVGTGLNYFQNHVRHEIGHAVGAEVIGGMSRSGNDFAKEYGGWQESSQAEFLAAMWSGQGEPATGWPSLAIGAASVTVTDDDVREWCIGVISSGREPANPLGSTPGTFAQKKTALAGSIWSGENLVAYLAAIPTGKVDEVPGRAFKFPGFTPSSPVQIFSTRWGDRFVKYSDEAYNAFRGISWYGLSSPVEMFAEMYTARYGLGTLPAATSGGDPDAFFTELEAQRDPMFGAPPANEPDLGGR